MAYVPIPKDLSKIKTKVLFNLTKRQLICFGTGAAICIPLFFLLRGPIGNTAASFIMIMGLLPFFLLAMYEKNGKPFEKVVKNMLRVMFFRPKKRPYKIRNYYDILEKQDRLEKEVYEYLNHGKATERSPGSAPAAGTDGKAAQLHQRTDRPGERRA